MINNIRKLAIIAGQGKLPEQIINYCKHYKIPFFIVSINGETQFKDFANSKSYDLGKISEVINDLTAEKVSHLTFAGRINKPDFKNIKVDNLGVKLLGKITKDKLFTDNSLLTTIIKFFEGYGFIVIGAEQLTNDAQVKEGIFTIKSPNYQDQDDIKLGINILKAISRFDIGQAVIVQNGITLGIEGVEGTENLIARCKELKLGEEGGVLIKIKKTTQDTRIDLPAIGPDTIKQMHQASFKGIALEVGNSIILNKEETIALANQLDIFIIGIQVK